MTSTSAVKNWLASQHILVDEEWLSGCIQYLTEESCVQIQDLYSLAREQWLLNDLKDVCPGSLPSDISAQRKVLLTGQYVLQVNCAIDIGTPAYQQYQKLKKVNTENIEETTRHEEKIHNHRMIKLYLTDGVQDVSAIEYRPIRNLTCEIVPGSKILIKGPVWCRRGVILLQEDNVECLGGEVEDLVATSCLPQVLNRLLGVQDAAIPYVDIVHQLNVPTQSKALITHEISNIPPNVQASNQTITTSLDRTTSKETNLNKPVAVVTGVPIIDNFDDDIDLDEIAIIEEQATLQTNKRPLISELRRDSIEKKFKSQNTNEDRTNEFPTDDDLFEDFDNIEIKYPIEVQSEPFVYIKNIIEMNVSQREGKIFKIKGQIIKLLSKLSIGKDGWSLKCTLIDGTGMMDVDFTSDVLTKLVGYSPSDMNKLKKEMAKNPTVKETVVAALNAAKVNLQVLNCIIEITHIKSPKITQLIPFDYHHAKLLQNRLLSTKL